MDTNGSAENACFRVALFLREKTRGVCDRNEEYKNDDSRYREALHLDDSLT